VSWGVSAGFSAWWNRRHEARRADPEADRFDQALDGYLKGNWIEAERLLGGLLRRDDRDVDARLMLATLLRHTRRFDEATRELNRLVRLEGAQKWALEIRREGELLTGARRRAASENTEKTPGKPTNGDS
jgi:predicted Zn-dependent protease